MAKKDKIYRLCVLNINFRLASSVKISNVQLKAMSIESGLIGKEKVRIPSRHATNAGFAKTATNGKRFRTRHLSLRRRAKRVKTRNQHVHIETCTYGLSMTSHR